MLFRSRRAAHSFEFPLPVGSTGTTFSGNALFLKWYVSQLSLVTPQRTIISGVLHHSSGELLGSHFNASGMPWYTGSSGSVKFCASWSCFFSASSLAAASVCAFSSWLFVPQQYAAAAQQTQSFTLPGDAVPGKTYEFQAADGRTVSFQVPQGMGPGSQVQVTY